MCFVFSSAARYSHPAGACNTGAHIITADNRWRRWRLGKITYPEHQPRDRLRGIEAVWGGRCSPTHARLQANVRVRRCGWAESERLRGWSAGSGGGGGGGGGGSSGARVCASRVCVRMWTRRARMCACVCVCVSHGACVVYRSALSCRQTIDVLYCGTAVCSAPSVYCRRRHLAFLSPLSLSFLPSLRPLPSFYPLYLLALFLSVSPQDLV